MFSTTFDALLHGRKSGSLENWCSTNSKIHVINNLRGTVEKRLIMFNDIVSIVTSVMFKVRQVIGTQQQLKNRPNENKNDNSDD